VHTYERFTIITRRFTDVFATHIKLADIQTLSEQDTRYLRNTARDLFVAAINIPHNPRADPATVAQFDTALAYIRMFAHWSTAA